MQVVQHPTRQALQAGLEEVLRSPRDGGVVALIVRRPAENEREVLEEATLDERLGVVGDYWGATGSSAPDCQVTVMNARVAGLVAGAPTAALWPATSCTSTWT